VGSDIGGGRIVHVDLIGPDGPCRSLGLDRALLGAAAQLPGVSGSTSDVLVHHDSSNRP
jgi:hypothetical protein